MTQSPAKPVADQVANLLIEAQNIVAKARTEYMNTAANEGLDPKDFDDLFSAIDAAYLVGMNIRRNDKIATFSVDDSELGTGLTAKFDNGVSLHRSTFQVVKNDEMEVTHWERTFEGSRYIIWND